MWSKSASKKESIYELYSNYLLSVICQNRQCISSNIFWLGWIASHLTKLTGVYGGKKKKKAPYPAKLPWFDDYFCIHVLTSFLCWASIANFIYGSSFSKKFITYFWLCLEISYVHYPTIEIHSIHFFYPPNWISCISYDVMSMLTEILNN